MIYGVFGGEYSDWFVVGYFENEEAAKLYCNKYNAEVVERYGEELYIKPLLNLVDNEPNIYRAYAYSDGNNNVWEEEDMLSETKRETEVKSYRSGVRVAMVWMKPCEYSEDKVRKIGRDAIAKYKAKKEGIT